MRTRQFVDRHGNIEEEIADQGPLTHALFDLK